MRSLFLLCAVLLVCAPVSGLKAQTDLVQTLTARPWCKTQVEAGRSVTAYERAQFRADGSATLVTSTVSSMSMGGMSMASSSWRTDVYRWRLEPSLLWLSRDGNHWTSGTVVWRTQDGEPVLSIDGVEYTPCR